MKEHEDDVMTSVKKSTVTVDSTAADEIVTERLGGGEGKIERFLAERDEGEDMMVDVVGAGDIADDHGRTEVNLDGKAGSDGLVKEGMEKETGTHDLDMEEVVGSAEDVCDASVGSRDLNFEEVEVIASEEGAKGSVEISKDVLQGNAVTAVASGSDVDAQKSGTWVRDSKMAFESSSGEPQVGGGDVAVIDSEELTERGLTKEVMEQHTESVEEVAVGDCMMDRRTRKEAEILDSSRIAGSSTTTANFGSQEVDMVVVDEGLASKHEAESSVLVDPSLVRPNNQNSLTEVVNAGTWEDAVHVSAENLDQKAEVDQRSEEERLHPTKEVMTDVAQKSGNRTVESLSQDPRLVGGEIAVADGEEESERGLTEEVVEQPMECDQEVADGDCVVNEKTGKEDEALDTSKITEPLTAAAPGSKDVAVDVEEGLASKNGAQDGVSVDPSLACPDNRSLSTELVNSKTGEGDVNIHAENQDQQTEVDKSSKKENLHPTIEVITNDAQKPENVTGVRDSKLAVDSSNVEPEFGGETAVIDRKETERGLTEYEEIVEPPTESVQEVADGDRVMDEKRGKEDEVLDPSKIPESLTTANLGPEEDDVMVVEEGLNWKNEAQDGDSADRKLVCPDNQSLSTEGVNTGTGEGIVHVNTENSDQKAEVDPSSQGESLQLHPTSTSKQSLKVGECIQRVASQLTGPPSVLKSNSDRKVEHGQHTDQVVGSAVPVQSPENSQRGRMIVESNQAYVAEMLSQLHLAAQDPMKGYSFLNTIIPFFCSHRAAVLYKSIRQNSSTGRPVGARKRKTSNENDPEEFEFDDVNDSYWTDRIIQNHSEEQLLQDNQSGGIEYQLVAFEPDKPAKASRRSNKKRFFSSNHEIEAKEQSELVERRRQNLATEVVLKFTEGVYFPSEIHLNKMFRRFGPLMESETEVDRQSGRARVVFKKCSDAEVAHSSAGKFNIFGSINVNYELNYSPLVSYKPLPPSMLQDSMDAS